MTTADDLLRQACEQQASDIHLTVLAPAMFRINGTMKPAGHEALTSYETMELAKQLMSSEQYGTFAEKGDLDFSYGIPGLSRFRINVFKQKGNVSLTIRLIPQTLPEMDALGLPDMAREFAGKPQGLVLVTGPTGSGKSTTLAAIIDYINRTRSEHIITLEDPIEFVHEHKRCRRCSVSRSFHDNHAGRS